MNTELKTEVEKTVQVIEEKVYITEETATSPKNEVERDVKIIENETENIHEELKMAKEGTDSVKAKDTTDFNVDTTADNAEQKPNSAKEGEPSGSVAADSSNHIPENKKETTELQVAWEVLKLDKKIYQKRGEEDKKNLAETLVNLGEVFLESEDFESATSRKVSRCRKRWARQQSKSNRARTRRRRCRDHRGDCTRL